MRRRISIRGCVRPLCPARITRRLRCTHLFARSLLRSLSCFYGKENGHFFCAFFLLFWTIGAKVAMIMAETLLLPSCNRLLVFTLFYPQMSPLFIPFLFYHSMVIFYLFQWPRLLFFLLVEISGFIWSGFDVLPLTRFGHFFQIYDSRPLDLNHFPPYSRYVQSFLSWWRILMEFF